MKKLMLFFIYMIGSAISVVPTDQAIVEDVVKAHILPRFKALAVVSEKLVYAAEDDCSAKSLTLRNALRDAFDAWISVSHLRFGPTEKENRGFALAFWPDIRGSAPRSLARLITNQDTVVFSPIEFSKISVATRGFYAMEFLIYDQKLNKLGSSDYKCQLVQALAGDIFETSTKISDDWHNNYAKLLLEPSSSSTYYSSNEGLREVFKSIIGGLQFTSQARLGLPLGTFERPRPKKAESWRSNGSAHNVKLSLTSLYDLTVRLTLQYPGLKKRLSDSFDRSLILLENLNDPNFSGVSEPQSRLKIEVVQQSIDALNDTIKNELGPKLGVFVGFNALDGD